MTRAKRVLPEEPAERVLPQEPPQSVADLVDNHLGGNQVVAKYLGIVPSAISNAKKANKLHEHWKWRLARLCQERGVRGYVAFFDKAS